MVRKQITNIIKNIQAMDHQLNKFKDSLSKIKDKLTFLRHSVITLIYSTELPDIKYK